MATAKDFSVEERLASLISVQKIDSKIDDIKKLRGELPLEVQDLRDDLEGLQTRVNAVKSEIASIEQFIVSQEELKQTQGELFKKYEKQAGNVKNSREFDAVNAEMEMAELEVKAADKKIRDARADIKGLEVKLADAIEKAAVKQDMLTAKEAELQKIEAETEKEEADLNAHLEATKAKAEPRLLAAYTKIRGSYHNGMAVVSVDRNSCGGCFNVIPPQRQAEIRMRKKMILCEHCGRILTDAELFNGTDL
ncbi:MAG: hypothetical protein RL660_1591 [Bacteroidota bacterium]|jgi:predicted  nucleic acid-binding Zn-ribbon protein